MRILPSTFDDVLKLIAVLGSLLSFLWGVWTWSHSRQKELENRRTEVVRLAEARRIESAKPFLEKQLKLYTEVSQVVSRIATSDDRAEMGKARKRFWELYWGELALVENADVEKTMVEFGDALSRRVSEAELKSLALRVVHACRRSLDKSWGINVWTAPDTPGPVPVSP